MLSNSSMFTVQLSTACKGKQSQAVYNHFDIPQAHDSDDNVESGCSSAQFGYMRLRFWLHRRITNITIWGDK